MGLRWTVEEFEADLYKVPTPRFWRVEKGELERKKYSDGEEKLQISFYGIPDGRDGELARVLVDGEPVCEVPLRRGRGRLEICSSQGEVIPKVAKGSVAEIEYRGEVVLRGVFKPD